MSIPITSCQICKAARGDEEVFDQLVKAMKVNRECGHWSQFPCQCDPPCEQPSDEQLSEFNDRMQAALAGIQANDKPRPWEIDKPGEHRRPNEAL